MMFFRSAFAFLLLSTPHAVEAEETCTKGITVPEGGDDYSEWPELWRLTEEFPEDPTLPHRGDDVGPEVLLRAGVGWSFLDPEGWDYPEGMEIPWEPPVNGTNDPTLQELREEGDFQYADIVNVTAYNEGFYEEHVHPGGDEVRYVIDGSGYFDIRDVNDVWVRMHARVGDLIVFPTGIEHRFAVDEDLYVQAMRLFPGAGAPDWSSVPRSEIHGNLTERNEYVNTYLCGEDPDGHAHVHSDDMASSNPGACYDTQVHQCDCAADRCSAAKCAAAGAMWTAECPDHCTECADDGEATIEAEPEEVTDMAVEENGSPDEGEEHSHSHDEEHGGIDDPTMDTTMDEDSLSAGSSLSYGMAVVAMAATAAIASI